MAKKIFKKAAKIVSYLLGGAILIVGILAIILWAKSPGKSDLIKDARGETIEGSISEIITINLGGLDQYLIIRGVDKTKPVMLFLHGGPGSPEAAFMKHFNRDIENDYVMVYWEQRGAGKSFSKNIPPESMTLEQMISDTQELSEYLIKRFNQEKLFLMGHSWGSFLGILTAYKHPELYYAYYGIGQVADQYQAEKVSFEWVKEQAKLKNDQSAISTLSKLSFPDSTATVKEWIDFLMVERRYVSKFGGGVTREITGMWPLVKIVLYSPEYTFREKLNFMNSSMFCLENLWMEVINTNLFNHIDSMQIPVYIFNGINDYQTSYTVAKDFFDQMDAPVKEFFTFENSAHSPCMEEVDKFNSIVKEKALKAISCH
ncbi:MAG: alpha/beta hydrolase [Bacteroidota bacterium]